MRSEWQQGARVLAALALVLLLGGADVDRAEDRGAHEQDRDRAHQAGGGGGAGEVLPRDSDEGHEQRPGREESATDVERVHDRNATERRSPSVASGEQRRTL